MGDREVVQEWVNKSGSRLELVLVVGRYWTQGGVQKWFMATI
jgi:hypothetical protein